MLGQVARDGERRRARVDHERRAVAHEAGRERADLVLRRRLDAQPHVHAGVGPRDGLRADRAAVRADEDAVGVEGVEVAADGVGGDVEPLGEVGDGHLPVLGHVGREVGLAARGQAA